MSFGGRVIHAAATLKEQEEQFLDDPYVEPHFNKSVAVVLVFVRAFWRKEYPCHEGL